MAWFTGDRVTWTSQYGTHTGTVVEDQVSSTTVRVRPDGTDEVGALLAALLKSEDQYKPRTVILDAVDDVYRKSEDGSWACVGSEWPFRYAEIKLPVKVIWTP